jgi:excinuclease ABC subunit C
MISSDVPRKSIPSLPGVYVFKTAWAQILYIGKAKQLKKRLQHYFTPSSVWKQDMVAKAKTIERFPVANEQEALLLELQLLNTHIPPFNNLIRGESSYFYLRLNREAFPRIELTRYKKNDRAEYFWPKLRKRDLKQLLQLLRHLFQRRTCTPRQFLQWVVCSDYFFGLCAGRCTYQHQTADSQEANRRLGVSSTASVDEAIERYEQCRTLLRAFFTGNTLPIEQYIRNEIDSAVAQEHFERAAKLRDIYHMITGLSQQQHIILDQPKTGLFALLEQSGNYWYMVVIRLYEGKIIDIITKKELLSDCDLAELTTTIQQTFGVSIHTQHLQQQHILYGCAGRTYAKRHLDLLYTHAQHFLTAYRAGGDVATEHTILDQLQKKYWLPTYPAHIETIDISHNSGQNTVGWLVCFVSGNKHPSGYRRYRIKQATWGDDYAAIEEVLKVRFGLSGKHHKTPDPAPDLLIIDGWKGQLNVCQHLATHSPAFADLLSKMSLMSIGKGKARHRKGKRGGEQEIVYQLQSDGTITSSPLWTTLLDQYITRMRDEAHRYANAYRKTLKRKEFSPSKNVTKKASI